MRDALGSVQTILVLGGTSEIAVATARELARRRARTAILACRDPHRAEPAVAELRAAGATTVETIAFDAGDLESHEAVVDQAFDRHGDIDLVLLAFGVLGDADRAAADRGAATEIVRTNFLGAVSVVIPVVRRLREQGHGTIVALSSVAGERVRKSNFVYGSSKAGLDGFLQGLGDSLQGTGVEVMVVRPGFVHTKMTAGLDPAPLSTTADAVAEAIVSGLARRARTVWVPPLLRPVMSVLRHLPGPVFRRLDL